MGSAFRDWAPKPGFRYASEETPMLPNEDSGRPVNMEKRFLIKVSLPKIVVTSLRYCRALGASAYQTQNP